MGLTYILLGEGAQGPRRTCWKMFTHKAKLKLHPNGQRRSSSLLSRAFDLFFCLPFDTFSVISAQKIRDPREKRSFGTRRDVFNQAGCLQLLLPQPQIVTISLGKKKEKKEGRENKARMLWSPLMLPKSSCSFHVQTRLHSSPQQLAAHYRRKHPLANRH